MEQEARILVVVPCGRAKIWDRQPNLGAMPASEVYTGAPFGLNREYAERFGDTWVILSAKYGFLSPNDSIPGPYEVTFKRLATGPVADERLREQIISLGLDQFPVVIGLGGKEYRGAIERSFAGLAPRLIFPFEGLPIGRSMQATKRSILTGDPGFQ